MLNQNMKRKIWYLIKQKSCDGKYSKYGIFDQWNVEKSDFLGFSALPRMRHEEAAGKKHPKKYSVQFGSWSRPQHPRSIPTSNSEKFNSKKLLTLWMSYWDMDAISYLSTPFMSQYSVRHSCLSKPFMYQYNIYSFKSLFEMNFSLFEVGIARGGCGRLHELNWTEYFLGYFFQNASSWRILGIAMKPENHFSTFHCSKIPYFE